MTNITVINEAADSTMSPDQRDLFDTFGDDTKQRFLNQILKCATAQDPNRPVPSNRVYQFLRRQVWFQRAIDDNLRPTNHLDEMDAVIAEAAGAA